MKIDRLNRFSELGNRFLMVKGYTFDMKKILEQSMKRYFQLRAYKFESWKKIPLQSQEYILSRLLNTAQYTQFGREHGFESIISYEQFKDAVGVSTYEDLFPYIEKMRAGGTDVLWPGFIQFFSKSSGTTNDVSKYIPISHDSLFKNHYRSGRDMYTSYMSSYPDSEIFDNEGYLFSLGGSLGPAEAHNIRTGDVSAILMAQLPKWAQARRKPSMEVALMQHWREKIPAMVEDTINFNVTHIAGVPTWFVSLFKEMKLQNPGKEVVDLWPGLELFIHGAVSFEPYRNLFADLLPESTRYLEVYSASEGFFAFQDDLSKQGEMLLLTDHGIFYEFIPMSEYQSENRKTMPLSEVEVGVDYALIVTTNAGLWRYDIGDTIQFTSVDPYRIKISGRTKQFINVFGEELMVGNAEAALASVCEKHDAIICDYTAGPIFMDSRGKGGHEWLFEFIQEPKDIDGFVEDLDSAIQTLNSDYKAKRQDNIALQPIAYRVLPEGSFESWMESRGKLGAQNKVPRLANTRKFLDDILNKGSSLQAD